MIITGFILKSNINNFSVFLQKSDHLLTKIEKRKNLMLSECLDD